MVVHTDVQAPSAYMELACRGVSCFRELAVGFIPTCSASHGANVTTQRASGRHGEIASARMGRFTSNGSWSPFTHWQTANSSRRHSVPGSGGGGSEAGCDAVTRLMRTSGCPKDPALSGQRSERSIACNRPGREELTRLMW